MEDRCVICGEIVPEGRQVCASCKALIDRIDIERDVKALTKEPSTQVCADCGKEITDTYYFIDYYGDVICSECLPHHTLSASNKENQSAKADSGKPTLSLVPKQIIYEIEKVRSFGVKKYKDPNNWKRVEIERYHQALLRHTLAVWEDINARDKESGLLHLSHIACNVAFLLEMMNDKE